MYLGRNYEHFTSCFVFFRKILEGKLLEYRKERQHHAQIYSYQYYRGDRTSQSENEKGGAGRTAYSHGNYVLPNQWLIGISIAAAAWTLRK
jgi:hypothetical protein